MKRAGARRLRCALGLALTLAAGLSCGAPPKPAAPEPPLTPLHLEPACSLAPSAKLEWLVDARPRAIAQTPELVPAIAMLVSEDRFRAHASAHGGVDLRQVQDLCVARYAESTLVVAHTPVDPRKIEEAFATRASNVEGRAVDVPNPPVLRMWGDVHGTREQIVVFGRDAVAMEQGRFGVLRASQAFALGKLKRAAPALRGRALAGVVERLGEAPLRVLAPGPFEGEAAKGLGGLLGASTALGVAARVPSREDLAVRGVGAKVTTPIHVRVVLLGAWGADGPKAAERLAAAANVLAESGMGHLFGLDRPVDGPRTRAEGDALIFEAIFDGTLLAHGMHDAIDAEVRDIMGH